MSAVEKSAPTISEPLTWAEICERYPNQWVCLVEMDPSPSRFGFLTARVVGHGATADAPLDQAIPWRGRYDDIGHCYTGKINPPCPPMRIVMTDEIRELLRNRR